MNHTNENVRFSLLIMPCCHTQLCWVNPRMSNYCPECGEWVSALKRNPESIMFQDDNAWLKHRSESK